MKPRVDREVFGATRTIVVTYNENLFVAQSRTLLREIAKRQQRLHGLQTQLRRWQRGKVRGGRAPTIKGARKKVAALLQARHMKDLLHVEITERRGVPHVTYHFDNGAWHRLQKTLLGFGQALSRSPASNGTGHVERRAAVHLAEGFATRLPKKIRTK